MKIRIIIACTLIFAACNQPTSTSEMNVHMAVPDIKAENLKGKIQQVETNTYLIDSATGKMGKLESKTIETFSDSGYTASYSNYTANDSSTTVYNYDHDARGHFTGFTATKNDKPLSSMKAEVDSLDKYVSATSFDSTGKIDVFYTDITLNDFGQILSAKGKHPDSTLKLTFENHYDSIYYTGGENKDSVGKTTYSATVKLNDKKDPASMDEESVAKDSTTKTATTYAYDTWDDTGNWTQQTITENGKPKKIVKRMITYKQ
jgi:hypothetical protein